MRRIRISRRYSVRVAMWTLFFSLDVECRFVRIGSKEVMDGRYVFVCQLIDDFSTTKRVVNSVPSARESVRKTVGANSFSGSYGRARVFSAGYSSTTPSPPPPIFDERMYVHTHIGRAVQIAWFITSTVAGRPNDRVSKTRRCNDTNRWTLNGDGRAKRRATRGGIMSSRRRTLTYV